MRQKLLFLLLSVFMLIQGVSAQTLIDGIYYKLDSSTKEATITYTKKLTGEKDYQGNWKYAYYYSEIPSDGVLPSTVTYNNVEYKVTKIDYEAFFNRKAEKVVVPEGYVSISDYAFGQYEGYIGSITLPTTLKTLASHSLKGVKKKIVLANTEVSGLKGDSLTYVSKAYPSYGTDIKVYSNLSSMFTVNGVKYVLISPSERTCEAFDCSYDTEETDITIDETVTYKNIQFKVVAIKPAIFACNKSLKRLTVNAKSALPREACYDCENMTDVTIGPNITAVMEAAFRYCSSIENVTIEESDDVLPIGSSLSTTSYVTIDNVRISACGAFSDSQLKSVVLNRNITYPNSMDNYNSPFFKQISLSSLTLGDKIDHIYPYEFYRTLALSSVKIPAATSIIDNSAFRESGLTSIVIPQTIDSIGSSAFATCGKLASVDIKQSKKELKLNVRSFEASKIVSLNLGRIIRQPAFKSISTLKSADLTSNVTYIPASAFYGCTALSKTNVPDGVGAILDSTYTNCKSLLSMELPESVQSIGQSAFKGCTALKNVNIPFGNKTINKYCFKDCSSLKQIELPNSIQTIEELAFENSGLNSIVIPTSVNELNGNPFSKCKQLTNLDIAKSSKALSLNGEFASTALEYANIGRELNWSAYGKEESPFASCMTLKTVLFGPYNTKVLKSMFVNCTSLDSVLLSPSINTIGERAFYSCSSLKRVNIPVAVKYLRNSTFAFSGLTELTLHNTVVEVEDCVFQGCKSFINIDIEDGTNALKIGKSDRYKGAFIDCPLNTTYIGRNLSYDSTSFGGYSPFYHNVSLKDVSLGDNVEYVSKWQFSGCSGIESFRFGEKLNSIGEEAFSDCINMTTLFAENPVPPICGVQALDDINKFECTLYVPNSALTDYQAAEQWKEFFFVEGYDVETIADESIELSATTMTVELGEVNSLQATVLPKNASDKTVIWKSSNENVVIVNEYGDVTGVGGGTAVVSATSASGFVATCKITVVVPDTKIAFSKSSMTMPIGVTSSLSVVFTPSNTTNKTLVWKSSNEDVAVVSDKGVVTAVSAGTTIVTATSASGNTTSCIVNVKSTPIYDNSISLDKENATLEVAETMTLTVSFDPVNVTDQTIVWTSSDESIATVSETGIVTAVSAGTVEIIAMSTIGNTATCNVTVKSTDVVDTRIELSQDKLRLEEGESDTLSVTFVPSNTTDQSLTWSSSNTDVVIVSNTGVVTAIKEGFATINVTSASGNTSVCDVMVVMPTSLKNSGSNELTVIATEGNVVISNAQIGSEVSIYSVEGILIARSTINSNTEKISVSNRNSVLVVNVGGECFKVLIK